MDLEAIIARLFRSALYAVVAGVGLYLAGAGPSVITPIALVIFLLQLMNIITYWASVSAGLLIIWGGLTSAGVTPGVASIRPITNAMVSLVEAGRPKPSSTWDGIGTGESKEAAKSADQDKLANLTKLCEQKVLTAEQCDAAKAKLQADGQK
jgi:hypothetical protein